jgi:hypothetical protein
VANKDGGEIVIGILLSLVVFGFVGYILYLMFFGGSTLVGGIVGAASGVVGFVTAVGTRLTVIFDAVFNGTATLGYTLFVIGFIALPVVMVFNLVSTLGDRYPTLVR